MARLLPYLYLQPEQKSTVATKANEFVRKYVNDLLLDRFMWASLGTAPAPA